MIELGRIVLALLAAAAGFIGGYWLPGAFLPGGWEWLGGVGLGGVLGWAVWAGSGSDRPWLRHAAQGAAWGGIIGFVGGFFGPMLFMPDANQGPMLGLFITGPGGALLGAVAGVAKGALTRR